MAQQVLNGASLSTSATNTTTVPLGTSLSNNKVSLITFYATGTFGGAKVKLQIGASASGGGLVWNDITSATAETSGVSLNVEVAGGYTIRPHLYSVSAGVTSVDAWIGVGQY